MSTIRHFTGEPFDFTWEDTELMDYGESESVKYASRRLLITEEKDGAPFFVFRYFRILPGGNSTMFDKHVHDHGVIILHGHCRVLVNGEEHQAGPMDVVYISQNDPHHLIVEGDEPLGFLCVIPNRKLLQETK